MLDKGEISAFQMAIVMYPTVLATGFISLPSLAAHFAQNDFWLTPVVASLTGFITIYAATLLHRLYPKQTFIQYSEHIIGKIPGRIVGFMFILFWMHGSGVITRQYAEFVTGNFLVKTPILVVISSIVLLTSFGVRSGLEVLARTAMMLTPLFLLPIFVLLFLIPEMDSGSIFPIMEHGMIPLVKGAAIPQAWFSEFFLISLFLPHLSNPAKAGKWSVISLCAIVASFTYISLTTLFVFGPDVGDKVYPILIDFRYIRIGNFLDNLESLLLAMWVIGFFIKFAVFFYTAALSLAQWMKLSDYRPVVFPIGLLIMMFSLWDLPGFSKLSSMLMYVMPFHIPAFLTLIPLVLLIAASFRKLRVADTGVRPKTRT